MMSPWHGLYLYLLHKKVGFRCKVSENPLEFIKKPVTLHIHSLELKKKNMDFLPEDPAILVSSVNMLLRDEEFDSLESLCYAFSREPHEIQDYLLQRGYVWSEQQKQFRPIGYDA